LENCDVLIPESQSGRVGSTADGALDETWRAHHRYLLDVAYRMLGSISEAEDVVQEAFTRLLRVDLAEINDVRGWLVVVVTRICLDEMRSARARRERYVGPWLPEPMIGPTDNADDPAERITLDDSVRMALLVVLERLSPAERAVFVLHDVFQFSFDDIASIVERTPAACRQLASRARRHVQEETSPARFTVDPHEWQQVTDRFITAAMSGDLDTLLQVLAPDAVSRTDSGGVFSGARYPIHGNDRIARGLLGGMKKFNVTVEPIPVNGQPGALVRRAGQILGVAAFDIRHGQITQIYHIANPYKLAYVMAMVGEG
jgi:RNA polymerase sigma-70 factor (ECF subfamily)